MASDSDHSYIDLLDDSEEEEYYDDVTTTTTTKRKTAGTMATRRSKRLCSSSNNHRTSSMVEDDDDDEVLDDDDALLPSPDCKRKRNNDEKENNHNHVNQMITTAPLGTLLLKDEDDGKKPAVADQAACHKYLRLLRTNVQTRTFSLSDMPQRHVVSTGRTIKRMKAWNGIWPAMRELLQNTIDHLRLMDRGRRRTCLDMSVSKTNDDSTTTLSFACGTQDVCQFHVSPDEIIIDQWYTYPIASRALDTGVPDTTKQQSSQQAGGFGDGFKTAAVALLANNSKDNPQLTWKFYVPNEKTRIQWKFQGVTREKIATFAKCQVLQVEITKHALDQTEFQNTFPSSSVEQSYVMRQCIQLKGIGPRFVSEVVPKFTVFCDLDESSLVSTTATTARGGDCLAPVAAQPPLFRGMLGTKLRPASGIYVRGIWVRPSKIKDTILSFHGHRLEVTGRDRNEVDDDQLVEAVAYVIQRCNNLAYLKKLLDPLRGTMDSSSRQKNKSSWLLQSPRFSNRVIELQKDFILQKVFEFPKGAIFVSSKTTNSQDAFASWAATFLKNHGGTPVVPIEKGAHKHLFEEVQRWELMDRCVAILKRNNSKKHTTTGNNQALFRKLVAYLGIRNAKLFVSPEVATAFCHNHHIFIPESPSGVTREMIVKVLNVCHSHLEQGGTDAERYSSLMQAIFELLPSSTTIRMDDVVKLVNRANEIGKENESFLTSGSSIDREEQKAETRNNTIADSRKKRPRIDNTVDAIDFTCSNDEEITSQVSQDRNNDQDLLLEQQIERVRPAASIGKDDDEIIPNSDFADDHAEDDCGLRASSNLKKVSLNGSTPLYCDSRTAATIQQGEWNQTTRVLKLHRQLQTAMALIRQSIPSLTTLLNHSVYAGYDGQNDTYEGFCNGQHIVINLFAFRGKHCNIYDFVVVVTHELAHYLEPRAGHGPVWRDTQSRMLVQVMHHLNNNK
mmetsp:Transcript_24710/g.37307  ORF Transcript_24710/g.37307 Transcript_24710/m.37307 type:complete len:956 (+) Transcript_24710:69-2936(+)